MRWLGIRLVRCRCPQAVRWTAWPVRASVPAEKAPEEHGRPKQYGLYRAGHEQDGLGPLMPEGRMGQVEERRAILGAGIHDLENGLKVAIQVDDGACLAGERQRFGARVPPAVGDAARELRGVARAGSEAPRAQLHRQRARCDGSCLILVVMDVERGPFLLGWECATQLEDGLAVAVTPAELKDFTGVSVFKPQGGWRRLRHGSARDRRMPNYPP